MVLQADLRGRFGEQFDNWWESAKASLPTPRVPFSVIAELRNHALKRGELLPFMTVVARVSHPAIEEVTFTVDLRQGEIVVDGEGYKFRNGAGLVIQLRNPEDSAEVLQELHRLIPAFQEIFRSLNEDKPPLEFSSIEYLLDKDGPAVSFTELIAGFSEHVAATARLVQEADGMFQPRK